MSSSEIIVLVAAVASALVSVVNAVAQGWGRSAGRKQTSADHKELVEKSEIVGAATQALVVKADLADTKLDQIHVQTNSNLASVKDQLAVAMARIDALETLLRGLHVQVAVVTQPLAVTPHNEPLDGGR